ncbi:MAG: antitoxin Xre/MbcA/ParS toxin-binding domain-containing protein [Verrucomicrobiota bacterium]
MRKSIRRRAKPLNAEQLISEVRKGLVIGELQQLCENFGLSMERMAPHVGLSRSTLHRRKIQGHLEPPESERVIRLARLLGRASEVFEDEEQARLWFQSPQIAFGGATPLSYADTEIGAREVEDLLGRLEHGVF